MSEETKEVQQQEPEENFADMLEQSFIATDRMKPGDQVSALIVKLTPEWAFIDLGGKSEGSIDARELQDESGAYTVKEGDTIKAYFLSTGQGERMFSTRLAAGSAGQEHLEEAFHSGMPVEGTVVKEVKGGFEIKIPGAKRAFCPFSQMGLRRVENAAEFAGQKLTFKISDYKENGRNIVLSHRAVLELERQEQKEALKQTLQAGQLVTGTVTSLRDFGAFVDLGGAEGLIPMSELGWSRVARASDVLASGQQVEVKVLSVDWEQDRISLSLKACLADPWDAVGRDFPQGSTHTGTVARLAKFGAFVALAPGVDGLVHISKLGGGKRINSPGDAVSEGQQIEVTVLELDLEKRRISLAPAGAEAAGQQDAAEQEALKKKYVKKTERQQGGGAATSTGSLGTFGDALREQLKRKK